MRRGRLELKYRGSKKPDLILFDVAVLNNKLEAEAYFYASAFNARKVLINPDNKKRYKVDIISKRSLEINREHFLVSKIVLKEVM